MADKVSLAPSSESAVHVSLNMTTHSATALDDQETDQCSLAKKQIILPISVLDTIQHIDDYPHQTATISLKVVPTRDNSSGCMQLKMNKNHILGTFTLEFSGQNGVFFDRNGTLSCSLTDCDLLKLNEPVFNEDTSQSMMEFSELNHEDVGFNEDALSMNYTAEKECLPGHESQQLGVEDILQEDRTIGHCYMCDQTLQDDNILMIHLQQEHGLQTFSCNNLLRMKHSPKSWHYYIAEHGNLAKILQKIDKNDPDIHACPLCGRERKSCSVISHLRMWHPNDSNLCELINIMEAELKFNTTNEFGTGREEDEETKEFKIEIEALKKENILERRKTGYCYLCDKSCFKNDKELLLHIKMDHGVFEGKLMELISKKPSLWFRFAKKHGFKETPTITPQESQVNSESCALYASGSALPKKAANMDNSDHFNKVMDEPEKKKHFTNQSHPCPLCGRSRTRQSLFRHLELWHADEPTLQTVIENMKGLLDGTMLLKPLSDKDKNEKFMWKKNCPFCKTPFRKYRSFYFKHVNYACHRNPNRTPLYQCHKCPFVTKSNEENQAHRMIHPPTRVFICELCGMSYASRCHYLMHKKQKHNIEIEEKKVLHKCNICEKEFFYENQLARHQFKHSDERRYQCDLCGHKSKTLGNLKAHQKTQHQNKYKYICSSCGHGVEKKKYLDAHVCGRVRRKQEHELPHGSSVSPCNKRHKAGNKAFFENKQSQDKTS